jgi:membrane-associated HD superfamily phosphohydrolase
MVRLICLFLCLLIWTGSSQAEVVPAKIPDYQTGDTATADVVTPISLIVIDPKATEAQRQKEIQYIQAVFRHDPDMIDRVEEDFHQTLANEREKFLKDLNAAFQKNKLDDQEIASAQFEELVTVAQARNKAFPLTLGLARSWAKGERMSDIETKLTSRLHSAMSHYIMETELEGEGKVGPWQVYVVSATSNDLPVTVENLERRSFKVAKTGLTTIAKVREDLLAGLSAQLKPMGRFLAGSIRTNCAFDPELTRQYRAKKIEPIWAADHYQPGQLIVKKGNLIDAKTKAALDQLRARTATDQLQEQLSQTHTKAQATIQELQDKAYVAQLQAAKAQQIGIFLVGALIALAAVFGVIFWHIRKPKASLAVVPASSSTLVSEARAEPSFVAGQPTLKAEVISELAHLMKDKVVQDLAKQRRDLLENQQSATTEMAGLEERLENLQAPLEERLKAYENRISELEKELAEKGEQNRELIKAKILLAKKQMEATRAKNQINWN